MRHERREGIPAPRLALLPLLATALLVAGCGEGVTNGDGEPTPPTATRESRTTAKSSAARGKLIKAVGSRYGRAIADGRGEALYIFDRERGARSRCYGACAKAWPPALTKGRPRARGGARQSLLGTTKRRNGRRQVTYAGHPLYYYVGDSPGTILCHDVEEFGGLWQVVKPSGRPVP